MQNYAAGWNLVGYGPNPNNVYVVSDWQSAVDYLADTIDRWWDQEYDIVDEPWGERPEKVDQRYLPVHTELHNAPKPPEWHTTITLANGDDWNLWIVPTDEPADE